MSAPTPTGRLAPSPTGAQHVGNARTYLIAWLSARARGGAVRLRIEDIDVWRNKPYAVEEALDDLRWLGLDWDGEVVMQSARLPAHEAALDELKRQELVYPCTCTRADIAAAASAPHADHEGPTYPRTCSHRSAKDADSLTTPFAWRFRVPDSPAFTDAFRGPTAVDLQLAGGDFVVWRAAKVPAYQLAVVTDDAAAGVTEVIRGDDLVSSTPRQLLLYRALTLTAPTFAHVPLVVGEDGRRLAKRHGDTRLRDLRQRGVTAERLLGLLAWSCGWLAKVEPISQAELLPLFRLDAIPRDPFVLTPELLKQIGG
jgi:glutamyl-tRNA synthetase